MQLISEAVQPIPLLNRHLEKIQSHQMNKSFDDVIISDYHNYNSGSSNFYDSCAPSIKNNRTIDQFIQPKRLSIGRNKGRAYPINFVPRSTDVIVGKGMNCYNHVGNKMLRNTIVAPKLAQYATTSSKKDKSILVTSILEQVRKNGGAFVKRDYETGLWHDAEPFLARDKVSQTIRNALNLRANKNKKRTRPQQEEEKVSNKQSKLVSSSSLFPNSINRNKSIITESRDEKVQGEKIHNSIITMLTQQLIRRNGHDNGNSTCERSLKYSGEDDNMLFDFFNSYAESFTNEVLHNDRYPLEPNPIRYSDKECQAKFIIEDSFCQNDL